MTRTDLLSNPMTTAGDVIYGGASGVPSRLAVGTAGQVLKVNAGATAPEWDDESGGSAADLESARHVRTSADYTITGAGSNVFADVDATNFSHTITTGARRVLIGFVGSVLTDNAAGGVFLDVTVDGTRQGGDTGLVVCHSAAASEWSNGSFTYLTDVLSAASHTFKLQWRQANTTHTATLKGNGTGGSHSEFWVVELYA